MDNYKYMVQTRCMTYNHAPYILEAMNGFCMQKTTFPFVNVIVDDDSTDGEPEVIEKYLQEHFNLQDSAVARREETDDYRLVFAQHKTSKNCYFLVLLLKYNHYKKKEKFPYYAQWAENVKYIAVCEGDDYWTDPLKLQKQVDFLESHNEYDMVCARFNHLIHDTGEIKNYDLYDGIILEGMDGMELKHEHFVYAALPHPCTVMYRNGTLEDDDLLPKLKYRYDIPTYYCFMRHHRVWLMNQKMAVYRKHEGSLTTRSGLGKTITFYETYKDIYQYEQTEVIHYLLQHFAKHVTSAYIRYIPKIECNKVRDFIRTYYSVTPSFKQRFQYWIKIAKSYLFRYTKGRKKREKCITY